MDPENPEKVVEPAMEEWGRAPFEQQSLPTMAAGASDVPQPEMTFKRLTPEHRQFAANVARLGYLVGADRRGNHFGTTTPMLTPRRSRPAFGARRVHVRKAVETGTEAWLKAGLPRGHGLAPAREMARQIVALQDRLLVLLQEQQERYARYVAGAPAGAGAHRQGRGAGLAAGGTWHLPQLAGGRGSPAGMVAGCRP